MYIIGLGGCCAQGFIERHHKFLNRALPFDFMRCKFSSVISFIDNDFNGFLPPRNTLPDKIIEDLLIYNFKSHAFYHHDLASDEIYDSFIRRIQRFNNYIIDVYKKISEETVTETQVNTSNIENLVFYRVITSEFINDEINLRENFYSTINKKYPNLKYKLIFIGFVEYDNLTQITYKKLDNNSGIFLNPVIVHCSDDCFHKISIKCMDLYKLNNYDDDCVIDITTDKFILKEAIIENKTRNMCFLDDYTT